MGSSSSPPQSPRNETVIVGREREQAMLRQALDAMLAGHGSLVLVSGEAGIGKTTLVEWLAREAEAEGCLILKGGCYDLTTTPPYGPWIELLRGYSPSGDLPMVPTFFSDPDALEALGSQEALVDEAYRFFASISDQQPLLLILEDLHWSDEVSVGLLRSFAAKSAASACC